MRNLFARLFGRRPAPVRRPAEARLRLEGLETRVVPASKLAYDHPNHHQISYEVTIDKGDVIRNHTMKKIAKKNILTLRNLPPGSYSVSYNARAQGGDMVLGGDE